LIIGRRFSAGYWRFPIGPVPEGRGEPSGLKMIPITSFAEKSDQAARFFVLTRSLRRFTPGPSGTGDPFLFLSTGAEAPAYSRSASPRRRRFYSPAIHPASDARVVSVLKIAVHVRLGEPALPVRSLPTIDQPRSRKRLPLSYSPQYSFFGRIMS